MSFIKSLSLLLILITHVVVAQTRQGGVRPPFTLSLRINDSTAFDQPFKETFYLVSAGALQIFPGDDIFVEADLQKDSLVNLRVVPVMVNKDKTLKISFSQDYTGNIHKQMMLKVVNPFSKNLTYKAKITILDKEGWESTSIVPVLPKLVSYELWPNIIPSIVLSDFKLQDKK